MDGDPAPVMSLGERLGLGPRELVALVGGGGKSTVMFGLGHEYAAAGKRVIMTTTTKMGREQAVEAPTVCWSADTSCAREALGNQGPVMLLTGGDDHKVTGPAPDVVDRLYTETSADYVIVEADGSWRRPLKAPAAHEPVIPVASTTVVILMGVSAVGRALEDVTHRVEQAVRFTGLAPTHQLTPLDCSRILIHPEGALRVCPPQSRVLVAVTQVATPNDVAEAQEISRSVRQHPRISDCVLIPEVA